MYISICCFKFSNCFYKKINNAGELKYYQDRRANKFDNFVRAELLDELDISLYIIIDTKEKIEMLCEDIYHSSYTSNVDLVTYKYDECEGDYWYLKINSINSRKEKLVNVMKEIGLTFKHFSNTRSISDFKFTVNDEFNKKLYYNYMELLRKEKPIETESFKVGTLCLFFKDVYDRNTVSENAGHAITIIKDKDDVFYVIDDAHVIVRFEKYIEFIYESMYEIELKDIDDESLDKLIKQFDQRENKSNHHLHFNKRIYRVVIKPRKMIMSRNVSGGGEYKMTNDSVEEVFADRDLQIKAQRDVMEKTLARNDRILKAIMLFGVIGFIVIVALSFIIKLYSNVDIRCSRSNC